MTELNLETYIYEGVRAVPFSNVTSVANFDSLEGYLELKVGGVGILTSAESGDVRDFWLLIVRMLPEVVTSQEAAIAFPASANSLSITRKGADLVRISCSVDPARTALVEWNPLARRLGHEAHAFFSKLVLLGYPEWELVPDLAILKAFGGLIGVDSWDQASI
jgi:hypothetical protein